MSFITRYSLLGALTFGITSLVGCVQDDDLTNYSPTQALPEELQDTIPDDNNEEPIDTLPETIDMNWFADFEGFPAFYGDSTTFQYSFDSIMGVHEFSCQDPLGRQMFILLDDLAPGSYALNFDSNIIRVIADTTVYDGGSFPSGSIQIIDTTGDRLTAGFDGSLTSFETGATLNVVNGLMENIPFD